MRLASDLMKQDFQSDKFQRLNHFFKSIFANNSGVRPKDKFLCIKLTKVLPFKEVRSSQFFNR